MSDQPTNPQNPDGSAKPLSSTDPFGLPPTGAPDLHAVTQAMRAFCITVAWLRDPVRGCPWDLKQDHGSLRRYMIEEAYEAAEAMGLSDAPGLCEELGDVLLQVVLNAQLALDRRAFSLPDVIKSIDAKMRRRHPHVFAAASFQGEREQRETWEEIKKAEKAQSGAASETKGVFGQLKAHHPATLQALAIGQIAARIDFDWSDPSEVMQQVQSEVAELTQELAQPQIQLQDVAMEIGDIYFSLAQLCRHLGLDPEVVSLQANQKFLNRFARVEQLAKSCGLSAETAGKNRLEELWRAAKNEEKKKKDE